MKIKLLPSLSYESKLEHIIEPSTHDEEEAQRLTRAPASADRKKS
jgi:hypothetical protein